MSKTASFVFPNFVHPSFGVAIAGLALP